MTVTGVEVEVFTNYTLGSDAVSVNPETKRDVRLHHEVSDSTTADVGVLVAVTVAILNKHNAKDRRNGDVVDSVRGAESGEEHVVNVLSERVAMRATERVVNPWCNLQHERSE